MIISVVRDLVVSKYSFRLMYYILQLLIHIQFNQPVKLHSLKLSGPPGMQNILLMLSFLFKSNITSLAA